ncbi:MAG: hypothetical protein IJE08_11355 [Clostridia bacterium]|nr:hypothetical protein [Clostridia bacterium]
MKNRRHSYFRALAVTVILFALLFSGAVMILNYVDDTSNEAQMNMVRDAVRNAVLTCYAVEGTYPESIEYLVEHYGLAYDDSRFLITYDAFASNIFPDIRVNMKGADIYE